MQSSSKKQMSGLDKWFMTNKSKRSKMQSESCIRSSSRSLQKDCKSLNASNKAVWNKKMLKGSQMPLSKMMNKANQKMWTFKSSLLGRSSITRSPLKMNSRLAHRRAPIPTALMKWKAVTTCLPPTSIYLTSSCENIRVNWTVNMKSTRRSSRHSEKCQCLPSNDLIWLSRAWRKTSTTRRNSRRPATWSRQLIERKKVMWEPNVRLSCRAATTSSSGHRLSRGFRNSRRSLVSRSLSTCSRGATWRIRLINSP